MNELRLLRPDEILNRWDELSKLLEPAVALGKGELEVDDIPGLVLSGRMFVMATDKFALTVEFITYPKKTVMVAGFGAGHVDDHGQVQKALEALAKKAGASAIQTYCAKPSMVRYYAKYFDDVAPVYTVLEKQL